MNKNKKVAFYTLGCKLNFSETSLISNQFKTAGYEIVAFDKNADIYVINTCSVTQLAEKKCRNIINKATKHKNAIVVVVGCYAQLNPEQLIQLEGVDIVLNNREKHKILEYVENTFTGSNSCDYRD